VAFERSGNFLSRIECIVAPARSPVHSRAVAGSEDDASEREIDAVVAAGDESRDASDAIVSRRTPIPAAVEFQRLISGLTIQRTASGGLIVEAPPETASTLAVLFSGMAQLFQAATAPPAAGTDPSPRP
jgi:hypothetical protein